MEKVFLFGLMDANIKDNMLMIKSKVMGNFLGQMEDLIKVFGKMVNKMEKEYIKTNKTFKDKVFGIMERKLNGQLDTLYYFYIIY